MPEGPFKEINAPEGVSQAQVVSLCPSSRRRGSGGHPTLQTDRGLVHFPFPSLTGPLLQLWSLRSDGKQHLTMSSSIKRSSPCSRNGASNGFPGTSLTEPAMWAKRCCSRPSTTAAFVTFFPMRLFTFIQQSPFIALISFRNPPRLFSWYATRSSGGRCGRPHRPNDGQGAIGLWDSMSAESVGVYKGM